MPGIGSSAAYNHHPDLPLFDPGRSSAEVAAVVFTVICTGVGVPVSVTDIGLTLQVNP
jgi:hypothetical protein